MNTMTKPLEYARNALCVTLLVGLTAQVQAQTADIASYPFAKYAAVAVRANMMFIMDNSGSMDNEFLPDNANVNGYCWGWAARNRVFYDPNVTYAPPVDANGVSYPNANFFAAPRDGYVTGSPTTDLSNPNNLGVTDMPQVLVQALPTAVNGRYYYSTPIVPGVNPCNSSAGNLGAWNLVRVLPAAQQTNYANWFSYYRKRIYTMKAAVGRVLSAIDHSRFRVGFSAISSTTLNTGPLFLPVSDFDNAAHRAAFYNTLYAIQGTSWTPLRSALDKIGKYYAKKTITGAALPNNVPDPIQYACQRNYAMLTTDGGWNTNQEPNNYTPMRLDGVTPIGNPDGDAATVPRPMLDDGRVFGGNWVTGGAGVSNTLADIAYYYYATDLRSGATGSPTCTGAVAGQDVCPNDVTPAGNDSAPHQHMTTFSLGFGLAGTLNYRPDYETAPTGSFADIRAGARAWPDPRLADGSFGGTPVSRVDDLWHAAVNGRGKYYGADNVASLVSSLTSAMDTIAATSGVAAAAATSSLQPVNGDNFMFIGEYTTVLWEGNLRAHTIDPVTGAVSSTPAWHANSVIAGQVSDSTDTRNIYFRNPVSGTRESFTTSALTAAGYAPHFANLCTSSKLSQCPSLDSTQLVSANDTNNVVNWIRGQRAFENKPTNPSSNRVFRERPNTPLGDVVNASPVYVKRPPFKYTDPGYAGFKASNAGRQGVVYLASNDGMLHALNADNGAELWAYVPSMVMDKMHKRADIGYATRHVYMVDGSPVVGDVFHGGQWRTILVGGLGGGGRGYYALDVTDPNNMQPLWEISNVEEPHLGLTFGNPVITKNKNGQWVVAFSSGYNNGTLGGNGNGHLYVRDAYTGAAIRQISTFTSGATVAGTAAMPSNLGKINAWVEGEGDNTATRIYGGDMKGNVWRFDFDDNVAPAGYEATLMAILKGPGGLPQPITTAPMLSAIGTSRIPVITVGTGRYLGLSDVGDQSTQSLYAFKEELGSTGLGDLRARGDIVAKTWTETTGNIRRLSNETVDWTTKKGWRADFHLTAGERVTTGMAQAGGYIGVATNIPKATACDPGGESWLYIVGVQGARALDSTYVPAMAAGVNMVALPSGIRFMHLNINGTVTLSSTLAPAGVNNTFRRNSWREIIIGR